MKKAKIDVLDIPDFDAPELPPAEIEEPKIDLQGESFLTVPPEEEGQASHRWRFLSWKAVIFFGGPVLLLCIAVTAVVVYFVYFDKKPSPTTAKGTKSAVTEAPALPQGPVYFDNLSAVVNDLAGKPRVVMFGVAAVPARGVAPNYDANDRDIRVAASRAVGGTLYPELTQDKGRQQIKKKIKDAIEAMKGPGTAENVYITSWTII